MATAMIQPQWRKYTDYNTQDPPDRPSWVDGIDNPYLHGPYMPVVSEITAVDLPVLQGEVPKDLYGAYLRQGPNPVFAPRGAYHWFDGDGMVHGLYLRDGRASYIRKWVQTKALHDEIERNKVELSGIMGPFDKARFAGRELQSQNPDYTKDTSNTTLNFHNGKLLSAWYNSGNVYGLDPLTLTTLGEETFGGTRDTTMNAHGKTDARTGEFINYGYADFQPWLTEGDEGFGEGPGAPVHGGDLRPGHGQQGAPDPEARQGGEKVLHRHHPGPVGKGQCCTPRRAVGRRRLDRVNTAPEGEEESWPLEGCHQDLRGCP